MHPFLRILPVALVIACSGITVAWWAAPTRHTELRVPGMDKPAGTVAATGPSLEGQTRLGSGQPGSETGTWRQFRGDNRTSIAAAQSLLTNTLDASRLLWTIPTGEGYAGPAICQGRVYLLDYDPDQRADTLRCLSLDSGQEIWRHSYTVDIKRNHGMSRTIPAVGQNVVITIGPKVHVVAVDRLTGEFRWGKDLVREFGTVVPPWYAGQCPLLDIDPQATDRLILAPVGRSVLLMAVEADTGKILWQTPNDRAWQMTHASIMPMPLGSRNTYVYAGSNGVLGVDALTGEKLWETEEWKVHIATVPSPLDLGNGRLLLTGGYGAGAMLVDLIPNGDKFDVKIIKRMASAEFGSDQQTPIFFENHIYGVRPDGQMVCLDRDGKILWASGGTVRFGLGAFAIADGKIFGINDSGLMRILEAKHDKCVVLCKAQMLDGARECWGPMAFTDGRLLFRDLTRLACLDLRPAPSSPESGR